MKESVLLYSKKDRLVGFSSLSLSFFFLIKKLKDESVKIDYSDYILKVKD